MYLKSIKTKFIVYIFFLIFCVASAFLTFHIYQLTQFIKEDLTDFGFHLVKDMSYGSELALSSEDPILLQTSFQKTFEEESIVLVVVYNEKGNIIAFKEKIEIEERIPKNVMEELLTEKKALEKTDYTQEGEKIYSFYSPVLLSETLFPNVGKTGEIIGFVRVGLSLEKITSQIRATLIFGIGISILIILLGISVAFFLINKIISPIKLLKEKAEKIAKGNFDVEIKIKTEDEFALLADSFNKMAAELKIKTETLREAKSILEIKVNARTKELQELAESLDIKVKERTKELQERMADLERFQKLAVGREFKMIALKEEIKKLTEKSKEYKKLN